MVDVHFDSLLIQDFTIEREILADDNSGGLERTGYTTIGTVKGRLSTISSQAREQERGRGKFTYITHILYCFPTDIKYMDIVTPQDRNTDFKLRVIEVKDPSNIGHHIEVQCELIEN